MQLPQHLPARKTERLRLQHEFAGLNELLRSEDIDEHTRAKVQRILARLSQPAQDTPRP